MRVPETTILDTASDFNIAASAISPELKDHNAISIAIKNAVIWATYKLPYRHFRITSLLRSRKQKIICVVITYAAFLIFWKSG